MGRRAFGGNTIRRPPYFSFYKLLLYVSHDRENMEEIHSGSVRSHCQLFLAAALAPPGLADILEQKGFSPLAAPVQGKTPLAVIRGAKRFSPPGPIAPGENPFKIRRSAQ